MGKEPHFPARRVDPAARAVTALGSRGLLASLRGVACTKSLFVKVIKFVAAFGARRLESGGLQLMGLIFHRSRSVLEHKYVL